jgi:glutathione-regulated potassium-efflux system ancillary protein KefC/glutathione-regulated potassium-efflux system protein KefB
LKAVLAVGGIIFGGRFAIRPLFRLVSSADSREVFSAAALLLILGVALLMESIGLSMALGAFLVGIVLSDSEYRHLLEADIEPFKGLLLGLFFISVGTSVDFGLLARKADWILASVSILLAVKFAILWALGLRARLTPTGARQMASALPQGGEFAFVLFSVASTCGILNGEQTKLLVMLVIASMAATPLIGFINKKVFDRVFRPQPEPFDAIENEHPAVIVAGFGRVGQLVARVLALQGVRFTALERDSEQANTVRRFGAKVYYGDASRLDLLEAAGARTAQYFVLAIDDVETSVKTAALIKLKTLLLEASNLKTFGKIKCPLQSSRALKNMTM